jgi:hypothetical protein
LGICSRIQNSKQTMRSIRRSGNQKGMAIYGIKLAFEGCAAMT